ncbi:hypothetical protein FDP41_011330 [Naegleria fowleri]|uniref:Vacuolar import/degradation Vid27 C-terminal domain-containing protein n=1 Tax=Naegleria fowleri TaxID=5763 RepID=A0A6A5C9K1_NAEFO|nr:uncharacterized protein FDP41_011330 [Naegleria fowleri]KAF0982400.1 hypothetical protein FDP41_011330 [Naegleria fowleri]CAG4719138.1 unnamed protein product [Naegleria fowleri]
MFSYVASWFGGGGKNSSSSGYNDSIRVHGSLIEYHKKPSSGSQQKPKVVMMHAVLSIDKNDRKGYDTMMVVKNEELEKDVKSFLLEEAMMFSLVVEDHDDEEPVIAYSWTDVTDKNKIWVFRFSEDKEAQTLSKCLSRLVYECVFENSYERDFEGTEDDEEELKALTGETTLPFKVETLEMIKPAASSRPSTGRVSSSGGSSPQKSTASSASTSVQNTKIYPSFKKGDTQSRKKEYEEKNNCTLSELCSAKCDLYLLNESTHIYECRKLAVIATIYMVEDEEGNSNFEYILDISHGDEQLIRQNIASEMNLQCYNEFHSITWNFLEPFSSWSLIFYDKDEEAEFKTCMNRCIYESNTCSQFDKLAIDDQEMLVKASVIDQAIDEQSKYLKDLDYEDEDYVDFISDSEGESEQYEEEDSDEDDIPAQVKKGPTPKYSNSLMIDNPQRERTFVVRGTDIGVFKRDDDTDQPIFDTQIKNVSTPEGELFVPYKAMLHNQDRDLLFLHKDQEEHCGKVYRMDLTRGEVVETWNSYQDLVPIEEIRPTEKFGDQLPTAVFGAMNQNTMFAMDPRIFGSDKVVGNINAITSKSNPQFSCFATTRDGRLVVGSSKGEIRLYSGIPNLEKTGKKGTHPKTAKTLLPGFGDPIIGIDVTANGEWVVATCKSYLMVIKTTMPDSDTTGFTERMGKKKPIPRIIQLLPEDVKTVGGKVAFKPAKFNTGCDGELWIVTSTGPYLITWNFKRITQNCLFDYTMKKIYNNENVVMSEFKNVKINEEGRHAPIIVTTPNDVLLEKKKKTKELPYKKRTTQYKKN